MWSLLTRYQRFRATWLRHGVYNCTRHFIGVSSQPMLRWTPSDILRLWRTIEICCHWNIDLCKRCVLLVCFWRRFSKMDAGVSVGESDSDKRPRGGAIACPFSLISKCSYSSAVKSFKRQMLSWAIKWTEHGTITFLIPVDAFCCGAERWKTQDFSSCRLIS